MRQLYQPLPQLRSTREPQIVRFGFEKPPCSSRKLTSSVAILAFCFWSSAGKKDEKSFFVAIELITYFDLFTRETKKRFNEGPLFLTMFVETSSCSFCSSGPETPFHLIHECLHPPVKQASLLSKLTQAEPHSLENYAKSLLNSELWFNFHQVFS
jgi:hypothetical protein